MTTKICKYCSQSFKTRPDRGIYCSRECRGKAEQTKYETTCQTCKIQFITPSYNPRKFCSRKCTSVHLSALYRFGGAPNWKGTGMSYRTLHAWVARWKGRPNICEHCGKVGKGHGMHWANVSKEYLRDLDDWIRLCPKCHKAFDT